MRCNIHVLTSLTFVFGAITVGSLCLSVSTDCWLLTREHIKPTDGEGKVIKNASKFWLETWSGLWRYCLKNELLEAAMCSSISYQVSNEGRENQAETTMTIIAAMRGSVPLPVTALFLALFAAILNVMGSIHSDVKTLVCAVFYVLAGLALAVGIILYISAINDEVGYRASSKKEAGGFEYTYGWSFFCAGISFMSSEIAAVISVTLYLRRNAKVEDMIRIIPGLEEKVDSDITKEEGINNQTIIL
ncbi:voltage-dependent calcium channel gamma-5 subunit-like [Haliotis cracherodii]|uniref:voltage-dependent calcium channel gamma-5 subunit-like n=1 Tax=Haliotis cracherodii TaxID=6455 RepID=UPI0039E98957